MPSTAKIKVSITLSRDLVERVDREASRRPELTRSSVIESWLRRAARSKANQALEADTISYYESLTTDERADDEAIASASSRAAKRLKYD
jgi:metal-responsive CopG/Arc/MetJ family transcriptional regulator